jgi:hypothetical protein
MAALVGPSTSLAADSPRPDIRQVEVSVVADAVVFRIDYAEPVRLSPTTAIALYLDADDDASTGDDGFELVIDYSGSSEGAAYASMWRDGDVREQRPGGLRFGHDGRSSRFTVPIEALGFPETFDFSFAFYLVIEVDGDFADAAPTHALISAAAKPYDVDSSKLMTREHLTFEDLADSTPAENSAALLWVVGAVLGFGALLALAGWTFERLRHNRSQSRSRGPTRT